MLRAFLSAAGAALVAGCSLVGIRSGYEQPAYEVVDRVGEEVEIRRYGNRLAAETVVEAGAGEDARDRAFRRLFDYISGANRGGPEIAMTAPVETSAPAEEIAMTVPVETAASDGGPLVMRFFLPASYTMASAPAPTDPRVEIVELAETTVAAERFTGSWGEERLERRKSELLATLARSDWQPSGTPTALFYDPPWTIPFLRRNEVTVPVTRAAS